MPLRTVVVLSGFILQPILHGGRRARADLGARRTCDEETWPSGGGSRRVGRHCRCWADAGVRLSQARFAELVGVAPNTVARWERGEMTMGRAE